MTTLHIKCLQSSELGPYCFEDDKQTVWYSKKDITGISKKVPIPVNSTGMYQMQSGSTRIRLMCW